MASTIIYILVGVLGIASFGSQIQKSILMNVSQNVDHRESMLSLFIYSVVLACHIPFIFFVGKEAFLIVVDEVMNQSLSKEYEVKHSLATNDLLESQVTTWLDIDQSQRITQTYEVN